MAWARLDDNFHDHPKVDGLSLASVGLYTLCLTWAHRHRRTAPVPGFIPSTRVRKLAGAKTKRLSDELVKAGLWHTDPDGFVIHDFGDYLPKERDPDERREAGRRGGLRRKQDGSKQPSNLLSNLPSETEANSQASGSSRVSARAFPTRPDPSQEDTHSPPARGGRLPEPFEITAEMRRWAAEAGYDDASVDGVTESFCDYWRGASGAKGRKSDWPATWRNWLRREAERRPRGTGNGFIGVGGVLYDEGLG